MVGVRSAIEGVVQSMDGREKLQDSPSTKVHFAEGGVVCWENRSHRYNVHSDRSHVRFKKKTYFVACLP